MEPKCKLATSASALIPVREGEKNSGKKIKLITNCFNIDIPGGYVYHYDIGIRHINVEQNAYSNQGQKPSSSSTCLTSISSVKKEQKYSCLSRELNRKIILQMVEGNQNFFGLHVAYDGRNNLYTRNKLKCKRFPLKYEVQLLNADNICPTYTRTDKYEVTVKPVKKKETDSCAINLDSLHAFFLGKCAKVPQEVVMVVETILGQSPMLRHTVWGRSFLHPPLPQDFHPLGSGREIWFGYHQSLRLGQWKPMVNLDIIATTFYEKGPVVKFIAAILNTTVENLRQKTHLTDMEIRRLTIELKNLLIETNHLQRYNQKYRIIRLTRDSAQRIEFTVTINGTERRMTVSDYFKMQYNIVLQFPQLPCLQVNPEAKQVYLPIEICDIIEGQHCKKKLEKRQNAEMIRFTARKPQDRFHEIENIVKRSDFERDPYLKEFGIKFDPRPLSLEGKVIESPSVRYLHAQVIKPRNGSWNMRGNQFVRPAHVGTWVLLSFANKRLCDLRVLNRFADVLCNIARETGMVFDHPSTIEIVDYQKVKISNLFQSIKQKHETNFMVVILPGDNKWVYGEVKQAAETTVGLITQCIMDNSVVKKCTPSLVRNLCQKINTKMGGLNKRLSFELEHEARAIIVALYVLRSNTSFSRVNCSIASVVASLDEDLSQYAVSTNTQTLTYRKRKGNDVEIVRELKSIMANLLDAFSRNNHGKQPEKIIVYRSSLSKSQFKNALETEVKYIREACKDINENYKPGVAFISVQKSNHIRFKPENEKDGVGKMKNIPPGAIIEDTVTDSLYQDFLLCSHLAEQGTSRATRYTVLENDTSMTAHEIQKLTYDLCHCYAPGTSSISVPAPVRYARLAGRRVWTKLLCYEENSCDDEFQLISSETALKFTKVDDALKNTMYFV